MAWSCVVVGTSAATLGSYASHLHAQEGRAIDEERSRLVVSSPFAGSLATLGLVALAVPVLVFGGDAGAAKLHEQGVEVAAFRNDQQLRADAENARRWSGYWSSAPDDHIHLVALECRVPGPPSPARCLATTSDALQPYRERARRNESRASGGAAAGGAVALVGAIGVLLLRRRRSPGARPSDA